MAEISLRAADNKLPTEELTKQMTRMAEALERYYHSLQAAQKHLIPRYLKNMYSYQASASSLTLLYQSQQVIRITGLLVVVSSAGQLSIGNFWQMPVSAGMLPFDFGYDGLMVEPGQALTLTQTTPGQIGMWAMGQEMASEGLRW